MTTIEVSFANRRKEKITAETVSLTDAPGWVVLKTAGGIVEMISASVIKRLRIISAEPSEMETPRLTENRMGGCQGQILTLPSRKMMAINHLHTPLIGQHV